MFNIIYCFLLALIIAAVRVGVAVFHLFRVLLCFWGRKTNEKAYIPGIYAICYRASHNFYHNADLSDALWLTPPGPATGFYTIIIKSINNHQTVISTTYNRAKITQP
ncbi:TPA: hypothetical protein JLZ73_000162 [Escherichia coli]|nr:hypothetical protein [Escherichia coli]